MITRTWSTTTSGEVYRTRSSSSSKPTVAEAGRGDKKSGQCPSTHIAATSAESSVPGKPRLARAAHGACGVSRPWCKSTPKLWTVSHSGLGARRTLVRSSVERGIVIMDLRPSGNCAHINPLHYPGPLPAFQYLSQKFESIPLGGCRLYAVVRKRKQLMVEHDDAGRPTPGDPREPTNEAFRVVGLP